MERAARRGDSAGGQIQLGRIRKPDGGLVPTDFVIPLRMNSIVPAQSFSGLVSILNKEGDFGLYVRWRTDGCLFG